MHMYKWEVQMHMCKGIREDTKLMCLYGERYKCTYTQMYLHY